MKTIKQIMEDLVYTEDYLLKGIDGPVIRDRLRATINELIPYSEIKVGIINSGGCLDQVRANVPVDVTFLDADDLDECHGGSEVDSECTEQCNDFSPYSGPSAHQDNRDTAKEIYALALVVG